LTEALAALNNATRRSAVRLAEANADTCAKCDRLGRIPSKPPRSTIKSTQFNDISEFTTECKNRRATWYSPTR